jgi:hypothetical protein
MLASYPIRSQLNTIGVLASWRYWQGHTEAPQYDICDYLGLFMSILGYLSMVQVTLTAQGYAVTLTSSTGHAKHAKTLIVFSWLRMG